MAIYAPIHGEMRGKLAGNVYSRNKGGTYVRAWAPPTNPNSTRQQITRAQLQTASSYWNTGLGVADREEWNDYAETHDWINSLGQSIKLTGLDWFVMVTTRLIDAGLDINLTPVSLLVPAPLATMVITFTSTTAVSVVFTPVLPSGGVVYLWGKGPINAGQDPNFKQMVLVGYSAADQATPWAATLPFTVPVTKYGKFYGGVMSKYGMCSTPLSTKVLKS